jgi:hypothetical protein
VLDLEKLTVDERRSAVKTYALTLTTRFSSFHQMLNDLYAWRHLDERWLERLVWGTAAFNFRRKTIYAVEIAATCDTLASFFATERMGFQILPLNSTIPDSTIADYSERVARGHWETFDATRGSSYQAEASEMIAWSGHLIDKGWWLSPADRGEKREPVVKPALLPGTQDTAAMGEIMGVGQSDTETQAEDTIVDPGRYPICKELVDPRYASWELAADGSADWFVHEFDVPWSTVLSNYPDLPDRPEFESAKSYGPSSMVTITDVYTRTHHAILISGTFVKDPTPHQHPGGMPVVIELQSPFDWKGADGAFIRVGRPFCMHMMTSCQQLSWILSAEATYMQRMLGMPLKHFVLPNSMYLKPNDDPKGPKIYTPVINRSPDQTFFPIEVGEDIKPIDPPPVSIATQQFAERMSQNMSMLGFSPGILAGIAPAGTSGYGAYQITLATRARMEPPRVSLERFCGRSVSRDFTMAAYWWDIDHQTFALQRLAQRAAGAQGQQISYADVANIGSVDVSINPRIRVASEQEITLMLQAHAQGLMSDLTLVNLLGYADDPDMELKRIAFEREAKQNPQYNAALAKAYADQNNLPLPQSMQEIVGQRMQQEQMQQAMQAQQQAGAPGQPTPSQPQPPVQAGGVVAPGAASPGGGAAAQMLAALQARGGQGQ